MRSIVIMLIAIALLLGGCAAAPAEKQQHTATYLTLFDTVTTIVGYADTEAGFQAEARSIHDKLLEYHRLFDIYNTYDGMNNLKTVNDNAGIAPVKVDPRIIDFLLDCRGYYEATGGAVNVAMGSVLRIWHDARTEALGDPDAAKVPDIAGLTEAALHTDFSDVVINAESSTVYLADPEMRLDVGAVAKGWAAQQVCSTLEPGFLVSVGGNVCVTDPKTADGDPWVIGIQQPDGDGYLHTLNIAGGSVVTSGDYQRAYTVNGVKYHHIIDPSTLHPSELWSAVTVVCSDSGAADALSTALFILPQDEGLRLLEIYDAEAVWTDKNGDLYYSPGFEELIRS